MSPTKADVTAQIGHALLALAQGRRAIAMDCLRRAWTILDDDRAREEREAAPLSRLVEITERRTG